MTTQETPERTRLAKSAALLSLVATSCNVAFKLAAGLISGSVSVLAEGLQSFIDILVAFGVLQTVRLAALPPDEEHPYGHGKAELLMSAVQMVLVLGTAAFIIYQAYRRLLAPQPIQADIGVAAMAFSAIVNTVVSWRLAKVADATGSTVLRSEMLHLRSDTISSLGIFCGLIAVWATGWTQLDPIMAAGLTLFVIYSAIRQLGSLIHPLMDGALPAEEIASIDQALRSHEGVLGYHNLRTRMVGSLRTVDIHVLLDDRLTFVGAHDLAEQVEDELSAALGGAMVNVHYEPYEAEMEHRATVHGDDPRTIRTL